jgi:hypothetical protein
MQDPLVIKPERIDTNDSVPAALAVFLLIVHHPPKVKILPNYPG